VVGSIHKAKQKKEGREEKNGNPSVPPRGRGGVGRGVGGWGGEVGRRGWCGGCGEGSLARGGGGGCGGGLGGWGWGVVGGGGCVLEEWGNGSACVLVWLLAKCAAGE